MDFTTKRKLIHVLILLASLVIIPVLTPWFLWVLYDAVIGGWVRGGIP